jgi:phytanoyl-CoA hydroxylase
MSTSVLPEVTIEDIEVFADDLDAKKGAEIFKEHGCLVVRGLFKEYAEAIGRDVMATVEQSISLLDQAKKVTEGWSTPNGALFLPAPEGYHRDKQIMCVPINYQSSAAFFQSGLNPNMLDLAEAILGPNVELYGSGQSLCKEPVGGHPKHLHQDSAYFEHKYFGPVAVLGYCIDTDLNNGSLHVVPGSFKLGQLEHTDTFSHLGLDPDEWPWERSLPVEGKAGDGILFHVRCIHGSKQNFSDEPRPIFIHRYRRIDDYVVVGGTTTENRAKNAEKPQQKKGGQRGFMVRGFRPYESDE